jgi:glycosyltransferase involved in cell wall biosynthesis
LPELNKHILILPKWYPNNRDIQLGIFVKQQALLLQDKFNISVIYVQSDDTITTKFKVVTTSDEGIFEQLIYFKKATGFFSKLINFKRYKAAQLVGYSNLLSKVDLVHVHVPIRPLLLALHLVKHKNIPFVVSEHWSGHLTGAYHKKNFLYKYCYKRFIKKASKISCVSEFLKTEFTKNTGITPLLIPNLIEQTNSSIEGSKIQTNQINILSVNDYIDSIKNITGLLEGFSNALLKQPNLHLTLIGGGPDETLINDTITKLNLTKSNLTILGRKPHSIVLEQMQNCDFYISNSNFETFGMTLAEALLAGKPVISKLCGGPNEFLNRKNSILIDSENNAQLEDVILKMANTFQTYNSTAISKAIVEKYGRNVTLNKLEKFYTL